MLFQNGALLTDLSVFENVAFPLREHTDLPERLIHHLVLTKLQAVGLRGAPSSCQRSCRRDEPARRLGAGHRDGSGNPDLRRRSSDWTISMGVILRLIRRLNMCSPHQHRGLDDVQEISTVADNVFLLSAASGGAGYAARTQMLPVGDRAAIRGGLADGPVPFHYPARLFRRVAGARRGS